MRHHLDKRAADLIAASAGNPDDLLTTREVAKWLGVSVQWLEIGRCKGQGPPWVRIGKRVVRYPRAEVLRWLQGRLHSWTGEYRDTPPPPPA
jgi:predicted DNA-binding transcriptional regulator AlpA